jgi:energy-converting hydrogenase B subunit Q
MIVSDPVQAGVMTVMAVARTARFDIEKQRGRVY